MEPNALRDQLAKLHEELGNMRRVDPRSNQLLGELLQDIKRLLDQPAIDAPAKQRARFAPPAGATSLPPALGERRRSIRGGPPDPGAECPQAH